MLQISCSRFVFLSLEKVKTVALSIHNITKPSLIEWVDYNAFKLLKLEFFFTAPSKNRPGFPKRLSFLFFQTFWSAIH
jgi:hypothetical protein